MQMKRVLTTISYFLSLVVFFKATGQKKKLSSGHIIAQTYDTLACEFEKYNWKKQPSFIKIRISGNDTTIYPGDIIGFINPQAINSYHAKLSSLNTTGKFKTHFPMKCRSPKLLLQHF